MSATTSSGERLPWIELNVGGVLAKADHQGELLVEGLIEGPVDVSPPDGWLILSHEREGSGSLELTVVEGAQHAQVFLEKDCTGPFLLLATPSEPLAGARLTTPFGLGTTDSRGMTPSIPRACGENKVWIWIGNRVRFLDLPVQVTGTQLVEVLLPPEQDAILVVVDEDGRPLEAEVRGVPGNLHGVQRIQEGRYRVEGPLDTLRCAIEAEGFSIRTVFVPMDGAEHLVSMSSTRVVDVSTICDGGCREGLLCGGMGCAGARGEYRCECPAGEATLRVSDSCAGTQWHRIGPQETEVSLDVRCSSSIRGRWAGRVPCSVKVVGAVEKGGTCGSDGAFELRALPRGEYTVVVNDQDPMQFRPAGLAVQQASRFLQLDSGQNLDLGVIEPDAGCVEGRVESDQPLDDASVEVVGRNLRGSVDGDGRFILCGLPMDEEVELILWSMNLGEARVHTKAGRFLYWSVVWGLEGGVTVSLSDESVSAP